ncbi:MAG: hypothetical protein K0U76_12875 [Actinomycetia bacterium]|nr:hypothetical protein [Actinomycetes bacterium]MCH9702245.1 hypothetical protein [Actinomycetes bacterium]MCH9760868.1 hypothetical protein [Actinomycetes bacterium]
MTRDQGPPGNPPKYTRLSDTRLSGEALWFAVLNRYELEQHELLILREIVRCVDDLDRLANVSGKQGAVTAGGGIHPALAEARQMRITLATLIGALRLPDANEEEHPGDQVSIRRPRRRPAVRSVDPTAPRPAAREVVRSGEAPPPTPAPRAVVRRIHPPEPAAGRHLADERTAGYTQLSVHELLTKVRKS